MNKNIECDVYECINNCKEESFCKLKSIKVTKINDSKAKDSTICKDFKTK